MTVFTHDGAVRAFEDATGAVTHDDEGEVSFNWDEQHVVTIDAPADLEGAFDTDQFYKIEGATIARPIKQPYVVGDEIKVYKKPAEELRKAAWSFDNAPFTLSHPSSGMVKNVDDIHGFWRNARYDDTEDRLKEDLYVPTTDDEALEWIEDNSDVSLGFFNRVHEEYDGDTGDLTDDDVDGFQVDMFGNHVAGVEEGRCSGEHGCGLDHGGDSHGTVVNIELPEEQMQSRLQDLDGTVPGDVADDSADADEECSTCNDSMSDENTPEETTDGGEGGDGFEIPDLSVDAIAEKNPAVREIVDERDELKESVDEAEGKIEDAIEGADNFSVDLDEDECYCDAVADLAEDLDEKADEVEDLTDELSEYREEERQEALDSLTDLGADEDDWEDADLEEIEEEIDRREEVAEDLNVSVKNVTDTSPEDDETEGEQTFGNTSFGRGHCA